MIDNAVIWYESNQLQAISYGVKAMDRRMFISGLGGLVLSHPSLLQSAAKDPKQSTTPPRIQHITGIALTVSDLERSRRFYAGVLGLEEDKSGRFSAEGGLKFYMESGHVSVWLPGKWEQANPHLPKDSGSNLGGKKHFNMRIDASEEITALANLQKHKVKFWGPRHFENGEVHIDFEDPDGHLLEYVGIPALAATQSKQPAAPRIKQIGEVAIVVQDLERSQNFYGELLGLERAHFASVTPDRGATFRIKDGYIGLWLPGKWKEANPHLPGAVGADLGGRTHFNLSIYRSDEQAAVKTLQSHNVRFWGPRYHRKDQPDGDLHIDLEDPDGHRVEFWAKNEQR